MGRNDDSGDRKGRKLFGSRKDPEKVIFGDYAVSSDSLLEGDGFDFGLADPFDDGLPAAPVAAAQPPPPFAAAPGSDDALLIDHEAEINPLPPRADIPVIGGQPVVAAPPAPAAVAVAPPAPAPQPVVPDGTAQQNPVPEPPRGGHAVLKGTGSKLSPEMVKLKARAHEELIGRLSTRLFNATADEAELEPVVIEEFAAFLVEEGLNLTENERADLAEELINDVLRHGPIEPLLQDPDVSEVMVNGPEKVYVEKSGRLYKTEAIFTSDDALRQVIQRMASKVGRRIDESSPMVDARLPDGSRVNAIIPPLAVDGSSLTIRKFSKDPLTVDDLVRFGSITMETAGLLDACVRGKLNMLVSGGTGSGKTTLLNVLSSFIPDDERIVTIEDSVELQLGQEHIVRLETRPANLEGRGAIEIRDLVKNSLRMRPDRIVVGECRGGEALDMLQAMNTGHDGSLSTLHANSPRDALSRLETMVLMAGMELPARAIREQIASAVDVIVQLSRLRDGTRRVMAISEVVGMEGDVITLNEIFAFDFDAGIDDEGRFLGHIKPTGLRPKFSEKLEDYGVKLDPSLFSQGPVDLLGGEW
jgi:pilus assembly protein CpaF